MPRHAWARRCVPEARWLQCTTIKSIAASALFQAQHDGTTVGAFVGYITALLLVSRVRRLTDVSQQLIGGMVVAQACFELLDVSEEPDDGTIELVNCRGWIQFDQVDVRYPGSDTNALNSTRNRSAWCRPRSST